MRNRNIELIKNTIILMIGQFVPKIMALIVLPILTGYLSKTEYGLYDLTLTVASFLVPLISVQIQQAVFRFLIEKNSNKIDIISSSFLFLAFMYIISSGTIISLWFFYIKNFTLSILFAIAYLFETILSWCGQTVRGLGKNLYYSLAYAIYSVVFVLLLYLHLQINEELNLEYTIIAMLISYFVSILFLFLKCNLKDYINLGHISIQMIKKLVSFSGPMVISAVALWVVNLSDRFCVTFFLGLEVNAIYAISNKIPNLINSFYSVFNLAWTENASRLTEKEKEDGYYSDFFDEFYTLLVGLILLLITISPLLFSILINNKYEEAFGLMSWLYVGVFFSSLVSFLGSIYVGEKKTKEVGVSSILGAILNLSMNIIFMKKFGVIIAALSTIFSYLVILLYRALDVKKYVVLKYDYKNIIVGMMVIIILAALNNCFSWMNSLISVLITLGYNLFYNRSSCQRFIRIILKKGR